MGALDTCLPSWPAQGTTIAGLFQDREERDRTNHSLAIPALEGRLKMSSDMVMVGFTTYGLHDREGLSDFLHSNPPKQILLVLGRTPSGIRETLEHPRDCIILRNAAS